MRTETRRVRNCVHGCDSSSQTPRRSAVDPATKMPLITRNEPRAASPNPKDSWLLAPASDGQTAATAATRPAQTSFLDMGSSFRLPPAACECDSVAGGGQEAPPQARALEPRAPGTVAPVIVERTEHPSWLSNAYLVADGPGGHGVLVDGNGVAGPLLERIEHDAIRVTQVLVTHEHGDHVDGVEELAGRFGAKLLRPRELADGDVVQTGDLEIRAVATPGHAREHIAFVVDGSDCLTGDVLFRRTVGGTRGGGPTGFADLRRSIMEKLLKIGRASCRERV